MNTIKLLRHITRTPDWARLANLRVDVQDVVAGLRLTGALLRFQQERGVGRAERVMGEVGTDSKMSDFSLKLSKIFETGTPFFKVVWLTPRQAFAFL